MSEEVYYFCRHSKCGHYGQFVAAPEEVVACPKCDRPMRRQDTGWMQNIDSSLPVKGGDAQ